MKELVCNSELFECRKKCIFDKYRIKKIFYKLPIVGSLFKHFLLF